LPGQFADAVCDNIVGCCQAAVIPFDLATCKTNLIAAFSMSLVKETSPNIHYGPNAAGTCLAVYASVVKSCRPDNTSATGNGVFVGTLPA
jgi:hypothetical protein